MPEHTSRRPSSRPSSRRCPQCSQPVKRVLRTDDDKRRPDADAYRRYRCRSDHCDWQGLLAAGRRRRRTPVVAGPVPVGVHAGRLGRMGVWGLLAGGVAWGAWSALQAMMAG